MDDEGGEILTNCGQIDDKAVVLLQALVRGVLVRKWIREVKKTYIQVLSDIEKNQNVCVEWDKPVSLPRVHKRRQLRSTKDKIKENQAESGSKLGLTNERLIETESATQSTDNNLLESSQRIPQLSSVETQTSFIVLNNDRRPSSENGGDDQATDCARFGSNVQHGPPNENNFFKSDRTSNNDKLTNMHPSLEEELESIHTESLKSESLNSDHVELYKNRQEAVDADSKLQSSEVHRDVLKEDNRSRGISHNDKDEEKINEAVQLITNNGDGQTTTKAFQINPLDDALTESETFESINSARSGSSIKSVRSQESENSLKSDKVISKERFLSDGEKENDRNDGLNDKRTSSDVVDELGLSDIDERPNSAHSQHSRRSKSSGTSRNSMNRDYQTEDINRIHNENTIPMPDKIRTSKYSDQFDERDVDQDRNKSPVSDRSETSVKSQRSDRSHKSERSQKSDRSNKSDRSTKSNRSHVSDRSRQTEGSNRSHRSRTAHSPRAEKHYDLKSPRPSSVSPVPISRKLEGINSGMQPRISNQDSTTLTNVTSVWDSYNSFRESHDFEMPVSLPDDAEKLKELRKNISMELLWVQQAINSRKNYLNLKNKM